MGRSGYFNLKGNSKTKCIPKIGIQKGSTIFFHFGSVTSHKKLKKSDKPTPGKVVRNGLI